MSTEGDCPSSLSYSSCWRWFHGPRFFKSTLLSHSQLFFHWPYVQVHRKGIYSLWYMPLIGRVLRGYRDRRQSGQLVPPCAQVPRAVVRGRGCRSSTSPSRQLGSSGLGLALLSLLRRGWGRGRQSWLLKGWGVRSWGYWRVCSSTRVQQARLKPP